MLQENDKKTDDIKPVRSHSSNSRTRNIGGGGVLLNSSLGIINLSAIVFLSIWFFTSSGNQQQAGQNFIERTSYLEEEIGSQRTLVNDLVQSNDQDLKFMNKEIRKLWDLSNKKNRKNISQNTASVTDLNKLVIDLKKEIDSFGAKQRARDLEFKKIERSQANLRSKLNGTESQLQDSSENVRIKQLEDATEAIDAYRKQINKKIIALELQLTQLESIIRNSPIE